ncbi:hypothetical protein Csa_010993 [Cucumis sativus]|uniref:Uncharacterized protein n=1 Tax=Cucumis sativus TaxID=3659 RepID=A0A0A0L3R3_CUCSA|nr:hypothetical protein Csa_010993 [Cucumis sativus]
MDISVGGTVENRLGLVIQPSEFSLMLRHSKGSIMEVVEVAKRDSVIGDGEESEWFWWWAEN